jgi:hypothetical protein
MDAELAAPAAFNQSLAGGNHFNFAEKAGRTEQAAVGVSVCLCALSLFFLCVFFFAREEGSETIPYILLSLPPLRTRVFSPFSRLHTLPSFVVLLYFPLLSFFHV